MSLVAKRLNFQRFKCKNTAFFCQKVFGTLPVQKLLNFFFFAKNITAIDFVSTVQIYELSTNDFVNLMMLCFNLNLRAEEYISYHQGLHCLVGHLSPNICRGFGISR